MQPTLLEAPVVVDEIVATYPYIYSPKYEFAGESHNFWELVYIHSGEAVIETPEHSVILQKSHVFLHYPNQPHKISANKVSCSVFIVSFGCSNKRLYEICDKPIPISTSMSKNIINIVNEGQVLLDGKHGVPVTDKKRMFGCSQIVKNLTELVLIELIRLSAEGKKDSETTNEFPSLTDKALANQIVAFMRENLSAKFTLEQVAERISYSVPYMCKLFKRTMGVPMIHYFNSLRIEKAKELMAEGSLPISEISNQLGFDTPQYFSRIFKKYCRQSPTQYLNSLKVSDYRIDDTSSFLYLK